MYCIFNFFILFVFSQNSDLIGNKYLRKEPIPYIDLIIDFKTTFASKCLILLKSLIKIIG